MTRAAHCMLAVIVLSGLCPLRAQVRTPADTPPGSPSVVRAADSSARSADTLRSGARPRKSPGLAMLLSAVVPGAGQFYNQSYW